MTHCQSERHQGDFPKAHLSSVIPFFISDLEAALQRLLTKLAGKKAGRSCTRTGGQD